MCRRVTACRNTSPISCVPRGFKFLEISPNCLILLVEPRGTAPNENANNFNHIDISRRLMWHSNVAHPCGTRSKVTAVNTCHVLQDRSNIGSLATAVILNDIAQQTELAVGERDGGADARRSS